MYRVPIADIADVTVFDNADKTIKGGNQQPIESAPGDAGAADFIRVPQGCTIKLVSKGPKFAWAELTMEQVKDGELVVDAMTIKTEPVESQSKALCDARCPNCSRSSLYGTPNVPYQSRSRPKEVLHSSAISHFLRSWRNSGQDVYRPITRPDPAYLGRILIVRHAIHRLWLCEESRT
jgi:hypothetical protein